MVGTRLRRKEDPPLLTGEARFVADLAVPGALHLALVRSPYANARITAVDASEAAAMPGVVAVAVDLGSGAERKLSRQQQRRGEREPAGGHAPAGRRPTPAVGRWTVTTVPGVNAASAAPA